MPRKPSRMQNVTWKHKESEQSKLIVSSGCPELPSYPTRYVAKGHIITFISQGKLFLVSARDTLGKITSELSFPKKAMIFFYMIALSSMY